MDTSLSVEPQVKPQVLPQKYLNKKSLLEQSLKEEGASVGLYKPTSNLFRHRQRSIPSINLKDFNEFLDLNSQEGWADFEGMTTFEDCVAGTLPLGFMPAVVPELKTITIGGAATGVGIESSSFKFGFVHECILEMDVVTATGQIITCSPSENSDLFFAFPNSYGTLGYALRVRMKVVPVKKYVELRHTLYPNQEKFLADLQKRCDETDKWDFVEGSVFNEQCMSITTGKFTDEAPYTSDYTYMDIYYQSIQKVKQDFLTTLDYIWRWDTDWFWCSSHFLAEKPWMRRLLGKDRLKSTTYWKIRSKASQWGVTSFLDKVTSQKESVIQDVEVPIQQAGKFLDFFHKNIGITPVWVCPTKVPNPKHKFDLYPMSPGTLYLNFGFWDVVKTDKEPGYHNRQLEIKLQELEGKKSLYSDAYYPEEEFWRLYNGSRYKALKDKYDPEGKFKDLYAKCVANKA